MKNNFLKLIVILLLIYFVFYITSSFLNKVKSSNKKQIQQGTQTETNTDQGSDENVTWMIGNNQIVFQWKKAPPGSDSSVISIIKAADYPKLFENLDYNVIKVTPFRSAKTFYLLSNLYYQAAGYTLHYAMIVDIWSDNSVQYKTNDNSIKGEFPYLTILDNGDIRNSLVYLHYDYCRSCGYYINEYLGFTRRSGFVTKNTAYKEEFKKLQADIEKNNHCAVIDGGKQLTFEEIKNQYGEDYRCRSSSVTPKMIGSSPKEYFELKDKVNRILKGEEVSLLNNNI